MPAMVIAWPVIDDGGGLVGHRRFPTKQVKNREIGRRNGILGNGTWLDCGTLAAARGEGEGKGRGFSNGFNQE